MNIIKVEKTTSTNVLLKELSEKQILEEGTVVYAGYQTSGKGQKGNFWESEAGKNITCSILLYPVFLPSKQSFLLSEAIALGVKETLDTYVDGIEIKWPNDIYYQQGKIAGILIENEWTAQKCTQSVAGIGLNVNQETFLSGATNPVSLKQITGKEEDPEKLLIQMVKNILSRYEQLKNRNTETIVRDYHHALYRKTGFYAYRDSNSAFLAKIEKITDDGRCHLLTDKGEKRCYAFKEVVYD